MGEKVSAYAYGTAMITDAGNRGAAYALDLKTTASAEVKEKSGTSCKSKTAKEAAEKVLELLGSDVGLKVTIDSEIPPDLGFGEKEASAAATCLAAVGALAKKDGSVNELKIDVYLKDQFAVVGGKLIDKKKLIGLCLDQGMRLDRTYSSFYGGFCIADNTRRKIERHGEMETFFSVILKPKKPCKVTLRELMVFDSELDVYYQEALRGNLNTAMNMNSTLFDRKLTEKMLSAGALAVSTSLGGGVVAFARDEEKAEDVMKAAGKEGKALLKKTVNEEARIQSKPKRIYKVAEFLELKGDQEYHWL